MILITSIGEFLLYFTVILFYFIFISYKKNKEKLLQDCFVLSCVACFLCRIACSSGLELESNGTPKGRTV